MHNAWFTDFRRDVDNICSLEILRNVEWQFSTDVSGQHIGPIFKGQDVQGHVNYLFIHFGARQKMSNSFVHCEHLSNLKHRLWLINLWRVITATKPVVEENIYAPLRYSKNWNVYSRKKVKITQCKNTMSFKQNTPVICNCITESHHLLLKISSISQLLVTPHLRLIRNTLIPTTPSIPLVSLYLVCAYIKQIRFVFKGLTL
jgi:hypothetical protein